MFAEEITGDEVNAFVSVGIGCSDSLSRKLIEYVLQSWICLIQGPSVLQSADVKFWTLDCQCVLQCADEHRGDRYTRRKKGKWRSPKLSHSNSYSTKKNLSNRSQWPRGLRHKSAAARLLRLWVLIPLWVWMSVCCECCVL